jgi:Putative auto-transporter adhesin, head GIN domain
MNRIRAWLLVGGSALLSGCGVFNMVDGSGKVVTEPRTVANFSTVSLSGDGELTIEQTGSESLTVTTDDNLLEYIKTSVDGSTLELGTKDNAMVNLRPSKGIVYRLTVKKLEGLEVSGSGRADAKRLEGDHLRVRISGSGEVSGQGTAKDLELRISGSGAYRGQDLKSQRAEATLSGSGTAVVNASEALNADVSGSGSIEYLGEPRVSSHVSGSGSVNRR